MAKTNDMRPESFNYPNSSVTNSILLFRAKPVCSFPILVSVLQLNNDKNNMSLGNATSFKLLK